jgi:hypothetical protein
MKIRCVRFTQDSPLRRIALLLVSAHFCNQRATFNITSVSWRPKCPCPVSTTEQVRIDPAKADSVIATNIQNPLTLQVGTYRETYRDSAGNFHTMIANPKWGYSIVYNFQNSISSISAKEKNSWNILSALHGFAAKMPNAPLLFIWNIYTYVCIATVLFSIFSGIWLWSGRKKQRLTGWLIFSGIILLSFSLMIFIYKNG